MASQREWERLNETMREFRTELQSARAEFRTELQNLREDHMDLELRLAKRDGFAAIMPYVGIIITGLAALGAMLLSRGV